MKTPYIIEKDTYADPLSQALLAAGAAFASENQIDPVALCADYEELDRYLDNGESVFIGGDPGTGKTSAFRLYCHRRQLPCMILPCSRNSRPSDFIGKTVFNPHKGIDGDQRETVFQTQGLLECFIKGIPVCIDDGTQATSDCMTTWAEFALMPKTYYCVENGVVYERHPNFRLVITGNPGCIGHNPLPENLESRVQYIDVGHVSKKGFTLLGRSKWKFLPLAFYGTAYDLCNAINAYASSIAKAHVSCGIRQLQKLVIGMDNGMLIPTYESFERMVRHSFLNILKGKLRADQYEAFRTAMTTTAFIQKMYDEYKCGIRPGAAKPNATSGEGTTPDPEPEPATDPTEKKMMDDLWMGRSS